MKIRVKLDDGAKMPTKAHEADGGFDLYCCEDFVIVKQATIDTGVHFEIPKGYVGFIKSKSGLNVNRGIQAEGVIDSGYTGSVIVKMYNHTGVPYEFKKGDKITQIVFLPIPFVTLGETDTFNSTDRGNNGFGSSGG